MASPNINQTVAIVDAQVPSRQAGVDADGNLKVIGAAGSAAAPSGSNGTDASSAAPAAAAQLLLTLAVNTSRIGYVVQNQSADQLQVNFDNGTSGGSIILLTAAGANEGGGSVSWDGMPHRGRIRVYGPNAGVQVGAREW